MSSSEGRRKRRARRLLTGMRKADDRTAQQALALTLRSVARIGSRAKLTVIDEFFLAALKVQPRSAGLLGALVDDVRHSPQLLGWFDDLLAEDGDPFGRLGEEFNPERLRERLGDSTRFDEAARKLAEKAADALPERKPEEKPKGGEQPAAGAGSTTVELPGGTTVTHTPGAAASTPAESEDEDDPRDEAPPTIYGEEIETNAPSYVISLHSITCNDVSGGLFNDLADDQLAWTIKGTAVFKPNIRVPVIVASAKVRDDVREDSVLSDLRDLVRPADEMDTHHLRRSETWLVNRFPVRGKPSLGQPKLHTSFESFPLADFVQFNGEMTLFEDDSEVKRLIRELFLLLQELASLTSTVMSAVSFGAAAPITTAIQTISGSDVFRRINDILQRLISTEEEIGFWSFMVTAANIEQAFKAGPFASHASNATVPEYVTGRPEQRGQIDGADGSYEVLMRYERYSGSE